MDKDTAILKFQQDAVSEAEIDIEKLRESVNSQELRLAKIQENLDKLTPKSSKKRPIFTKNTTINHNLAKVSKPLSYDELYHSACDSLVERGIDPDNLDYHNLVSEEEIEQVTRELNSALPREEKWTKSDFITVFIAAVIGSVADFVLSNRDNELTGQHSKFSEWLNETLHEGKHATNAPIDYQGKDFGGGFHRQLSKGHDIARFVEGIKMFKNGTFEGIKFVDGIAYHVMFNSNQFGNPYAQLSTIEAILGYSEHMFADLFSKVSLPFPGYSFLRESNSRRLRKLSADMYQNGFNCKNIIIQSISTISIEVIIRIYFSIISVKRYHNEIEIAEDYSNIEAIKKFVCPDKKEKLNEMLLVAHAIVSAVNIGKVVITKNLAQINVTEIMSVVRYGVSVVSAMNRRNNEYNKLIYHANKVNELWAQLDEQYLEDEKEYLISMSDMLVIA